MIKVELELDYTFLFTKKLHRIENALVKFLKWTADFDFKSEPPIAPVWIKFPGLKLHLFDKQILFSLATVFGKPLKLDHPTFNLSRPSAARVLVEMDISFSYTDEIWIGSHDEGYWQEVVFDSKPLYCSKCRIFGHSLDNCFITNPHLRQDLAYKDNDCGLNGKENNVLGGECRIQAKENLNLQSHRPIIVAVNQHGGTSDCSNVHDVPTVPLLNDPTFQLGEKPDLEFRQTGALPNSNLVSNSQQLTVTGIVDPVTETLETDFMGLHTTTNTNKSWTALGNMMEAAVPPAAIPVEPNSSPLPREIPEPENADPVKPNSSFPAFKLAVSDSTCTETDKQRNLGIEDSSIDCAAVFPVVKGKEIDPNCSISNTIAAMDVTTQSLMSSAVPNAAALPTTLQKHAPVYNSQPKFTSDFISDHGNTDSDSYEIYTGSYREEDMQLNEACKEVLEEWQEEWEFQK